LEKIEAANDKLLSKHFLPKTINFDEGTVILVNKPLNWTSFDVVNRIKYAIKHNLHLKKIKIGHAGTLDPMADGLLIICTGRYTKLLENLSGSSKTYIAKIKIGATTPCFDREGEEENIVEYYHITRERIIEVSKEYIGLIDQVPPIFSAVKIKGKNAYSLARRGKDIELKSRQVNISQLEITEVSLPYITFNVNVSKGTYIRSLANDIGKSLGVGAYLYNLTRTSIGEFNLDDALEIEDIVHYIKGFNNIDKDQW
jgi:tRNA pseudouridine55 synthase